MSAWLIIVTGCIYSYVAFEQGMKGNYPLCIMYIGYSWANIGAYLLAVSSNSSRQEQHYERTTEN